MEDMQINQKGYAREWREKVKEYQKEQQVNASRYKGATIGNTYMLIRASIPHITIIGKKKQSLIGEYLGKHYRIPRKMLGEVINTIERKR